MVMRAKARQKVKHLCICWRKGNQPFYKNNSTGKHGNPGGLISFEGRGQASPNWLEKVIRLVLEACIKERHNMAAGSDCAAINCVLPSALIFSCNKLRF